MAGSERPPAAEYRNARIGSAALLFSVVGVIVLLDAFRADFDVNPFVLIPMLAAGLGLLYVDVPFFRRPS